MFFYVGSWNIISTNIRATGTTASIVPNTSNDDNDDSDHVDDIYLQW